MGMVEDERGSKKSFGKVGRGCDFEGEGDSHGLDSQFNTIGMSVGNMSSGFEEKNPLIQHSEDRYLYK